VVRGRTPTAGKPLTVDGLTAVLVRKRVKNVTLRVYPPDGRVEVSAPMRMPERDVVAALVSRRAWIERHRRRVAAGRLCRGEPDATQMSPRRQGTWEPPGHRRVKKTGASRATPSTRPS